MNSSRGFSLDYVREANPGVVGLWSHVGNEVHVEVVVPLAVEENSLVEGSLLALLSDVVWDNEALDRSLDLEVPHSSVGVEQVLVRVATFSEDVLEEEASSEINFVVELKVVWDVTSLQFEISSVLVDQVSVIPVINRCSQLVPPGQDGVVLLVPVSDAHVAVWVLEVGLRWAGNGSGTTEKRNVDQLLVDVLLKSHHPDLL